MSDTDFRNDRGNSANLQDKLSDAGSDMKQRAGEAMRDSAEIARQKLREAADVAKDVASNASDRIQEQARNQQHAGADYMERMARNVRNAAAAFEQDTPFAARGINAAASHMEDAANKLRSGGIHDLINSATEFARRQPTAFLGLSVLAGFAAIRFLKASDPRGGSATEEFDG